MAGYEVLHDGSALVTGTRPHLIPQPEDLRSSCPIRRTARDPSCRPTKGANPRHLLREVGYDDRASSEFEAEQVVVSAATPEHWARPGAAGVSAPPRSVRPRSSP